MFKWFKKSAYAGNIRRELKLAGYNEKTVIMVLFGSISPFTKWAEILMDRGVDYKVAASDVIEYLQTSSRYQGDSALSMTCDQPSISWSVPWSGTYLIDKGWIED